MLQMNVPPKKNEDPRQSYTFDAIPEDDERQEELNRVRRKPGEPGYCRPAAREEEPRRDTANGSGTDSTAKVPK
jgi:hypothetical protein